MITCLYEVYLRGSKYIVQSLALNGSREYDHFHCSYVTYVTYVMPRMLHQVWHRLVRGVQWKQPDTSVQRRTGSNLRIPNENNKSEHTLIPYLFRSLVMYRLLWQTCSTYLMLYPVPFGSNLICKTFEVMKY